MFYIYTIQNKLNNKLYVGKTGNLKRRWGEHRKVVNGGKEKYGRNFRAIHAAMKKYGIDNFHFQNIESWNDEIEAREAEIFWIEFFQSNKRFLGYNETAGGDGFLSGKNHPLYGTHPSEETRKKLSIIRKGKSPVNKGMKHSDETRLKISQAITGPGNGMFGKHHTEEGKKNISNSRIGQPSSQKGIKKSEEEVKNMSERALLAFSKLVGENCINAKLSNKDVVEIRDLFEHKIFTPKEIWEMYNISKPTLYRIIKKTTYKF